MKILITGAGGMLGSDLAFCLKSDFTMVGVGRRPVSHLPIPFVMRDLSVPRSTLDIFERERPEIIFHAAGMTDVDACERNRFQALQGNLEVTRNVVEGSNRSGSLLIFFSTDYVFDGFKKGEYEENEPPHPINVYGETKYLAEKYIQRRAEHYLILRLSWLYGLYGRSFPGSILERAAGTKDFTVVSDQVGRPTYTRDVAVALTGLLKKDERSLHRLDREIFHVANDGVTSWAEFAAFILKAAHCNDAKVHPIPSGMSDRPAMRPANSVFSLKKTQTHLGLRLRPWQEAIGDFVEEWMAKEKPAHEKR